MSHDASSANDPMSFVRNLWGNMGFALPGMVTPTFDVEELEKRITDLKAVEGWLKMNLSMLQMTIQGLEMQKSTLSAVRAMGDMASQAAQQASEQAHQSPFSRPAEPEAPPAPDFSQAAEAGAQAADALSQAAMWPWNMMQQVQEHLQAQAEAAKAAQAEAPAGKAPRRAAKPKAARPAGAGTAKKPRPKA